MFVIAQFSQYFFGITLFLLSVFLILLVLVQRGRGGGITGALGGPGGQSAFGTKTGDVFTRITVITAIIWILFCVAGVWTMKENDLDVGNDEAQGTAGLIQSLTPDSGAALSDSDIGLETGLDDSDSESPSTADSDSTESEASDSTNEESATSEADVSDEATPGENVESIGSDNGVESGTEANENDQ